jgi:alpha-ketoglutarate-dependent taurine dioxygenase
MMMEARPIPRRQAVALTADAHVESRPLVPGRDFPLAKVSDLRGGLDALAWLRSKVEPVRADLRRHGAVLLRGFALGGLEPMAEAVRLVAGRDLAEYDYRSTPRTRLGGGVYTSTEYPADQSIPMHNEMSYARSWPRCLGFWCRKAARDGGETPLADSHAVYQRLDPALRRRFEENGVMYVRNYGVLDLPWQEVFQTSSTEEVERYCAEAGIEWEWKGNGRLVTRQICQAVTVHPETGKSVWFNQAHLFHVSSLAPAVRASLLALLPVEDLPRNACYGDGSPIADAVITEINAAFAEATCVFPWEDGDFLLVDNLLLAHGRRPFQGEREVLVAMA